MPEETERPQNGVCTVSTEQLGDGILAVAVAGELDLYTSPQLERALAEATDDGARAVLVDLSECEFVDSTALGVLLVAYRQLRASDRRLAVIAPDRLIRHTFELTGLDRILPLHKSRAAVLEGRDA